MADFLFITPQELIENTIIGGNVDVDKYMTSVASVQISVIEPLLGTELYDKIKTDAQNSMLTGLYETLYNEYVKPITKNQGAAEYIKISPYMVVNGGVFKHAPEDSVQLTSDEIASLSQVYQKMSQMYVIRFEKWIGKNEIPEYKTSQDEVNAQKDIKLTYGWLI